MVEQEHLREFSQDSPSKHMLRRFRRSQVAPVDVLGNTIAPHQLPENPRICIDGHKRLSEALKKRYEDLSRRSNVLAMYYDGSSLPIASTAASRTNSLKELQGKATKFNYQAPQLV